MAVALPTVAISGITLASGTATFLEFIHEEAVQTAMMALFIADKNRMEDQARKLIEKAANKYLMRGVLFTRDFGWLTPYSVSAFKTYWLASLDMLETYATKYNVDITKQADRIREIVAQPIVAHEKSTAEKNIAETKEEALETIATKTYDCDVLAHIEAIGKEPKDKIQMSIFRLLGHTRRVTRVEITGITGKDTDKGIKECERRRKELAAGTLTEGPPLARRGP